MKNILFWAALVYSTIICGQSIDLGVYKSGNRKAGYLVIKKNHMYEQKMSDCTWAFKTKGTYSFKNDTIYITPLELYSLSPSRRKGVLITDTGSFYFRLCNDCKKYVFKNDSLFAIRKYSVGDRVIGYLEKAKK